MLERGKQATTTLMIYEDGAAVVPTSATFTLINEEGGLVIDGAGASVSGGGELSYIVLASQIPSTLSFSDSYLIEWRATIAGVEYLFRRPCALARSRLYPVISDIDLFTFYADLNSIRPSSIASYQPYITEAFIEIVERLRNQGNFEYLIIDSQALRSCHLDLTFTLIWRDMDSSGLGAGRYLDLSIEHRKAFEAKFRRLRFRFDLLEDGEADDGDGRRASQANLFTSHVPNFWAYRRRW